ncbi:MAG: hypothetical protein GF383_10865 [Candidatus Lokiarchaeota archaeon]|nr:hypothetical protein [Candidatus Lokiarchaeota archaeon]MBD3341105.1 hypothetical protein [Candidatus Lokiarchaeota archaeon]
MSSKEDIAAVAKKYLTRSGYGDSKIVFVEDKLYKWLVKAENSSLKFQIEITKSGDSVIKFEIS